VWFDSMVEWCPASVNELNALSSVQMNPNPVTDGVLHLTNTVPVEVIVSDLSGRTLHTQMAAEANAAVTLPALSAGLYLVTLRSGDARITRRVVVQ